VTESDENHADAVIDLRLEQVEPDVNTTVIKDARVAQAALEAQTDSRRQQVEDSAAVDSAAAGSGHGGSEKLLIFKVHSW
jgi:hypothetical protein